MKKLIRTSQKSYETRVAETSNTNPKNFYKYVNDNKNIKSGIGPLLNNGQVTSDDKEVANTLNSFFSSVFTLEQADVNCQPTLTSQFQINNNFTISANDVMCKLNNLDPNKSQGPDKLHPQILKSVKEEIAEPLSKIFNKSLQVGQVPAAWKEANVTPIFKKGDKSQANNYRPISLTSVIGKVLKTILRDKIVEFLESNNLIKNSQHGFRSNKSCVTNLIDFYNRLLMVNDITKSLDIIFLDFQKAFDKVPHKKLLLKMEALGITGKIFNWIEDWLTNRRQRVVVNGAESDWAPVTSGVPQGSVLGPVLFIIYINDLDVGINNYISKFADDTKLGNAILNEEDRATLQADLHKIEAWSTEWQMPFNIDKCQLIQCGSNNKNFEYNLFGQKINKVRMAKDLGIIITDNLKSSEQCAAATNKANRMLGYIKRNFKYKSKDIILPLYKSLVRPHLEYGVQFWSPYLQGDIEKMERVQRRATKLIPSLKTKSYEDRLKKLNLFSLKKRRMRGQLIECFKILKGFDRIDTSDLFQFSYLPTRNNGMKLRTKKPSLDITKNFFSYYIIKEWNKLPNNVVTSTSINMFKNRLDAHLKMTGVY